MSQPRPEMYLLGQAVSSPSFPANIDTNKNQSQWCFNANVNLCFAVCLWPCLLLQGSTLLLRQQLFQLRSWPLLTQIILDAPLTSSQNLRLLRRCWWLFLEEEPRSLKLSNERYSEMTQIAIGLQVKLLHCYILLQLVHVSWPLRFLQRCSSHYRRGNGDNHEIVLHQSLEHWNPNAWDKYLIISYNYSM